MQAQDMKFCQSCSMPMNTPDAKYGTEADGSLSQDYCSYCYENGHFNTEETMEQMVEACVPYVRDQYKSDDEARAAMMAFFPQLKRWS